LRFNVSVNTVISGCLTLLSYEELRDFLNLLVNLGVKGVNFIDLYTPGNTSLKPSYKELLRFSTIVPTRISI
jgi:MoaA/NifB/PqqE/SkfB family radical SAM enzyme